MGKKLGLVLGSGAARGWAHVGVLQGLEEIGVKPDVIAGCSVGALVGGAHLLGALKELEAWARELSPLSAFSRFALNVGSGGLIDAAPAFKAFEQFDKDMAELPVRFGAVAADLGTGEEVEIIEGSVLQAARASSAIPIVLHAVQRKGRWLVDGAVINPAPVSLARKLGAEIVISVDLNAVPRVLDRFNPPPPSVPAIRETQMPVAEPGFTGQVGALIDETRRRIEEQLAHARARAQSKPQLFETAFAAADIFQMHLSRARYESFPPDITIAPDMRNAFPTSFDRADEFIEEGRKSLLARAGDIEKLLA